jgi:hypothetical protein
VIRANTNFVAFIWHQSKWLCLVTKALHYRLPWWPGHSLSLRTVTGSTQKKDPVLAADSLAHNDLKTDVRVRRWVRERGPIEDSEIIVVLRTPINRGEKCAVAFRGIVRFAARRQSENGSPFGDITITPLVILGGQLAGVGFHGS